MLPSPINPLRLFCTTWIALIGTFGLAAELPAADTLRISELMAAKQSTLADQDGEFSDWIEIQNPTPAPLSLGGWYLTDTVGALTKWRFPNTNVAAYGFLIVFASNKDRSAPGAELHTNFKLNEAGEYLALVQPDGVTVASEYAPQFPVQVPNVSYGIPSRLLVTNLISAGASARVLVPLNGNLGSLWLEPAFDDAAWPSQVTESATKPIPWPSLVLRRLSSRIRFGIFPASRDRTAGFMDPGQNRWTPAILIPPTSSWRSRSSFGEAIQEAGMPAQPARLSRS